MVQSDEVQSIQFGTDGWRGIIAADFTVANVCRVTRAIAHYLTTAYSRDRPVLVSYDTRFMADTFAQIAAQVLAEAGWAVKIVDRDCPTPVIAFNARYCHSAGALMFTASHNPAAYCGIKYIPDFAAPAPPEITNAIASYLPKSSDALPNGEHRDRIAVFDPKPPYLKAIYELLEVDRIRQAKLTVKYDALYSTSRGYLDEVLEHCGCAIETFHAYRDVTFGGENPDPKGKQLQTLVTAMKRERADLGLATDGDSDRVGIVDELGTVLTPNQVLLVLTRHLVCDKGMRGAIVRTVATTHLLDTLAAQYGLPLYETPVGFKYIGAKMREVPVLIGGEDSGGLSILGHIPEKDGILAGMLVAEAIAYAQKPLSQLVREVIAEAGGDRFADRLDLGLSDAQKTKLFQILIDTPPNSIASLVIKTINRKDGIKLYLEDSSWILLRPSGTEPLMRVYVEAPSQETLHLLIAAMREQIERWTKP